MSTKQLQQLKFSKVFRTMQSSPKRNKQIIEDIDGNRIDEDPQSFGSAIYPMMNTQSTIDPNGSRSIKGFMSDTSKVHSKHFYN